VGRAAVQTNRLLPDSGCHNRIEGGQGRVTANFLFGSKAATALPKRECPLRHFDDQKPPIRHRPIIPLRARLSRSADRRGAAEADADATGRLGAAKRRSTSELREASDGFLAPLDSAIAGRGLNHPNGRLFPRQNAERRGKATRPRLLVSRRLRSRRRLVQLLRQFRQSRAQGRALRARAAGPRRPQ
jgi:hypothetical protein